MTTLTRTAHDVALMKMLLRRVQELGAHALVINLECEPETLYWRLQRWQQLFPSPYGQTRDWLLYLSRNYELCQAHDADRDEFADLSVDGKASAAIEVNASEPLPEVIACVWNRVRVFQWLSNKQYS